MQFSVKLSLIILTLVCASGIQVQATSLSYFYGFTPPSFVPSASNDALANENVSFYPQITAVTLSAYGASAPYAWSNSGQSSVLNAFYGNSYANSNTYGFSSLYAMTQVTSVNLTPPSSDDPAPSYMQVNGYSSPYAYSSYASPFASYASSAAIASMFAPKIDTLNIAPTTPVLTALVTPNYGPFAAVPEASSWVLAATGLALLAALRKR